MKYFLHVSSGFDRMRDQLRGSLVLCCIGLLLLLSACGNVPTDQNAAAAQHTPVFTGSTVRAPLPVIGGAAPSAAVSFTASTSYATALRLITGLGLQLQQPCQVAQTDAQGKIIAALAWSPVGQKEYFKATQSTSTHGTIGKTPTVTVETILPELSVYTTAIAPADWLARLHASTNVSSINAHVAFSCPSIGFTRSSADSPTQPARITSIAPKKAGTDVLVTFAANGMSYDDALYIASNMGFRLAAPCYEQEVGKPADWHPMGQQDTFARSHTLTLATTDMSPTDWVTRITHTAGVAKVDASYKAHC
jgi:hypothetical protein